MSSSLSCTKFGRSLTWRCELLVLGLKKLDYCFCITTEDCMLDLTEVCIIFSVLELFKFFDEFCFTDAIFIREGSYPLLNFFSVSSCKLSLSLLTELLGSKSLL